MKHGECIFVSQGEYLCMCTTNLNLVMQKASQVVQIISALKSIYIIYIFLNEIKKLCCVGSGTQNICIVKRNLVQ